MPELSAPPKDEVALRALGRLNEFYRAARKGAWDVDDLGWDRFAPVPRAETERWNLFWASVVQQQLQADRFAIEAATDLLLRVEEREAILYYSSMVQDEARHVEGWTRLRDELIPVDEKDPYLQEMGEMLLDADTLEERVIGFQVVFEGLALNAFKDIASATEQTILGEMSARLVRDDSIHHNSGVAYAKYLLQGASDALIRHLDERMRRYRPLYFEHITWRPKARQWLAKRMEAQDERVRLRTKRMVTKQFTDLGLGHPFED